MSYKRRSKLCRDQFLSAAEGGHACDAHLLAAQKRKLWPGRRMAARMVRIP